MAFAPLIKCPLTDFEALITPYSRLLGNNRFCGKLQLKYTDCLEAYGLRRGGYECAPYLYDVYECLHSTTQIKRRSAIQKERLKLYKEGKIDKPFLENPPLGAFIGFY